MKKTNKNRLILISVLLVMSISTGMTYLNNVFLPQKIKALIIKNLEKQTHKNVNLSSLRFSFLRGLVLKDLVLSEGGDKLISIKEVSCTFLILPVFKKIVVIPTLNIKSPVILAERRKDSSINLGGLWPDKKAQTAGSGFSIFVYRLSLEDGRIDFRDDTITPAVTESITNLHLTLSLIPPGSVKFSLEAKVAAQPLMKVAASGRFKISGKELTSKIIIKNLSLREFIRYSNALPGVFFPEGIVDAVINLRYKEDSLDILATSEIKGLALVKDNISARLNSNLKARARHNLINKQLEYAGEMGISRLDIEGLEAVDKITGIRGIVRFNNSSISSDKLNADLGGIPLEAKFNISDLNNPLIDMAVTSSFDLNAAQLLLKDKLKFSLPGEIQGTARLNMALAAKLPVVGKPKIKGTLDIKRARIQLEKIDSPFKEVSGLLEFTQDDLGWSGLSFKYLDLSYQTNARLTDFQAPTLHLELTSKDLSIDSDSTFKDKVLNLKRLSGKYMNSNFDINGIIGLAGPQAPVLDLEGGLDINLEDLPLIFKKFPKQWGQIKPRGIMNARFDISGNPADIKSSAIKAKVLSPAISIYGLRLQDLSLDYTQKDGLAEIAPLSISCYNGNIEGEAKVNLNSPNFPYFINTDIQGIKIEQLKQDTPLKDKDISGALQLQAKINGFVTDPTKISGAGRILINNGNLWKLDLFRGLGQLLFTEDFKNIVFNEAVCDFLIKESTIYSDNIRANSNIINLQGRGKVGFDGSLDMKIHTRPGNEALPVTGTIKDITSVLLGGAGRFMEIRLTGMIREPKYRIQPRVSSMIEGLKDMISTSEG